VSYDAIKLKSFLESLALDRPQLDGTKVTISEFKNPNLIVL